jgi:hypothetical protein
LENSKISFFINTPPQKLRASSLGSTFEVQMISRELTATASLKIDEGLKEGVAKGFGMLAQSLLEFVEVQKAFSTGITEMQETQAQVGENLNRVVDYLKVASEKVLTTGEYFSAASSHLNESSDKLTEVAGSIKSAVESQASTSQLLGEISGSAFSSVKELIGLQTDMQSKFKASIDAFDLANRSFSENVTTYHAQQNMSLSNSLKSFDGALAGAVEKLDGGLGNLNIVMNDFIEKLDQAKQ